MSTISRLEQKFNEVKSRAKEAKSRVDDGQLFVDKLQEEAERLKEKLKNAKESLNSLKNENKTVQTELKEVEKEYKNSKKETLNNPVDIKELWSTNYIDWCSKKTYKQVSRDNCPFYKYCVEVRTEQGVQNKSAYANKLKQSFNGGHSRAPPDVFNDFMEYAEWKRQGPHPEEIQWIAGRGPKITPPLPPELEWASEWPPRWST